MLSRRIIPSLLLDRGRLVKGVAYADHRDAGRPETTVRALNAQGADEILLLDINASREGRGPDMEAVRAVAVECRMPLCVGGGIRDLERAHRAMEAGADKLCLTTAALDAPPLLTALSRVYGAQAVVLGVDVSYRDGEARLYDHRSGTILPGRDLWSWIAEAIDRGAGELRLAVVEREGSRQGFDLALLAEVMARVRVPVIFEAGAGSLADLDAGLAAGADALAIGTMMVFSDNNMVKIKRYLAQQGHRTRI